MATLGTAGHVDHGKTALVRALTGRDTDRLADEHRRGISIELGYAPLALPSGRRLSVVDVPGHERFVRTMVAGASGVDLFLLCVAADDGVMPQTREHLAVLRHLGIGRGVVAVTKVDLTDPAAAAAEAAELVPGAEAVAVSSVAGTGLEELLDALDRLLDRAGADAAPPADGAGAPRLHVDRSFTLRGIGTVVTGTLWSGAIAAGDSVVVLPSGRTARVRSVQVHDEPVERAIAGQRVALALTGIGWRELGRGDVVSTASAGLEPTYLVDARIELEPDARPLRRGERVQAHHGTRDAPARVVSLEGDALAPGPATLAQLRLEAPLVPAAGDRLILRQLAPPDTVGGGVVIDAHPRKHGGGERVVQRLVALERGERPPAARQEPEPAAEPEAPALDEAALRVEALLRADGAEPRTDVELAEAAGLDRAAAADRLRALERAGRAVRAGRNLHFDPEPLERLTAGVVAICERDGGATIAGVRDELGTTRKYAQAILEHLDAVKVTRRRGDVHVLRSGSG